VHRYFNVILLSAALAVPMVAGAQDRGQQQGRHYEDRAHNDSHDWNAGEDEAYRRYLKEHHKKNHDFAKAKKREQDDYWKWRHSHPDNDHR
jgi:hypothetical protein